MNELLAMGSRVGGTDKTYADDVFSTYLHTGNGADTFIKNNIELGAGIISGTVGLVHFDGIDNGTTATDVAGHAVTLAGTIVTKTAIKRFGTASVYNDSTLANSYATLALGYSDGYLDADFTIDYWAYHTDIAAGSNHVMLGPWVGSQGNPILVRLNNGASLEVYMNAVNRVNVAIGASGVVANTWQHYAITRSGDTCRFFLNGTQVGSSWTMTSVVNLSTLVIAAESTASATADQLKGYIDEVRVLKGVAAWTANFTPETAAYSDTLSNVTAAGKGGMVWIKNRGALSNHFINDTARGAFMRLKANATDAQASTSPNGLTEFNHQGFVVKGTDADYNASTNTFVSHTFRKAPKFFDVVTYSGSASNQTINHSLGSVPGLILIKDTGAIDDWMVYHRSIGATQYLSLNQTIVPQTLNTFMNNTEPTATQFTVGTTGGVNATGHTYVAYLFAHDTTADGIIQCGSFTTDVSGNATVNLGWEPQYILLKRTDVAQNWFQLDTMRGWVSTANASKVLIPNTTAVESTVGSSPTATGFTTDANLTNASATYAYMVIRRPNKPPTSGTQVYNAIATSGTTGTANSIGFPLDLQIASLRAGSSHYVVDRLRGISSSGEVAFPALATNTNSVESSGALTRNVTNTSFEIASWATGVSQLYWNFRRAPGVFDVVCYTGNSTAADPKNHNLGVAPELVIVKYRNSSPADPQHWVVYCSALGNNKGLYLSLTNASFTSAIWGNTTPTSSVFYTGEVGNYGVNNATGYTYVAYLFATKAGISKVGSYTGNGTNQTINCGFSAGARFVLIKRTDSTGDWYVWDSTRGIVASTDPHLSVNSAVAEVTTDDSIDPDANGFIVNQDAATNINVNTGTYIFLAFA